MKTLELNQMEKLHGGTKWSCYGAAWGLAATFVAVAAGPVGWLAIGFWAGSTFMAGATLGNCLS